MPAGTAEAQSAATAARRSSVAVSAWPSTRSGRQRRWKADSSTGSGRSEFLSVFPRRRRPRPDGDGPEGGSPPAR